jgi:hypothetical protein
MGRRVYADAARPSLRAFALVTVLLVLVGCARTVPVPEAHGPVAVSASGKAPVTAPLPTLSAPIAPVDPVPTATATPTATPTPTPPPRPVDPLAGVSAKTLKAFRPCLHKSVGPGSGGRCARLAQKKLKSAGFYPWGISGYINTAGVNAILNYQRSRGLTATGRATKATWVALATKARTVPSVLPKKCKAAKGVILCVDQAHRKLSWIKNGKVVKTFKIRLGGWNFYPKTKKWKVFATANGTWRVYSKNVDPPSEQYGRGAMPYATIFYPDMYVHYSPGFHAVGYSTSSHGCVNIGRLSDAIWIFRHTPIGARVHIFSPKATKSA